MDFFEAQARARRNTWRLVLLFAIAEGLLITVAAYLGYLTRFGEFPVFSEFLLPAVSLSVILVSTMVAMGVYEARVREGMTGMSLRTATLLYR